MAITAAAILANRAVQFVGAALVGAGATVAARPVSRWIGDRLPSTMYFEEDDETINLKDLFIEEMVYQGYSRADAKALWREGPDYETFLEIFIEVMEERGLTKKESKKLFKKLYDYPSAKERFIQGMLDQGFDEDDAKELWLGWKAAKRAKKAQQVERAASDETEDEDPSNSDE